MRAWKVLTSLRGGAHFALEGSTGKAGIGEGGRGRGVRASATVRPLWVLFEPEPLRPESRTYQGPTVAWPPAELVTPPLLPLS